MNKIASAILFDVGCRKLSTSDDSFFAQSKICLSRLILRKMFAEDSDDVGVILFGSDSTENCMMEKDEDKYSNIRELCNFGKPNFNLLDEIEKITQCKGFISDWILGMIVAVEYLRKGIQGKRYKVRQLVIFSEFPACLDYKETVLTTIASCMKDLKVKLTVVGPDMNIEDIPNNLNLLFKLFEMIDDPLSITIDELADSIKYFEKKKKGKRIFNVDLEIGSTKIPVGWVKLTSESQRFSNWVNKQLIEKQSQMAQNEETLKPEIKPSDENMELDDDFEVSSFTSSSFKENFEDVFKVTKFGQTEVNLSSADLSMLKRESGPPSFKILMFTSKSQVNPTKYVGEDIFAIMPREGSNYAQAKLYALIDAMREKNKVAIARRVVMRNGKIQLGVLIPFSDECGKHLYFLKLPSAEWTQPFPRLRGYPKVNSELRNSFKDLINSMRLTTDLFDESVLVPDPHFQLRCQLFTMRAQNPNCDLNDIPEYINNIVKPSQELKENTEQILVEIMNKLPSLNSELRKDATKTRAIARKETRFTKPSTTNGNLKPSTSVKSEPDSTSNISVKGETHNSSSAPNDNVENEELSNFYNLIDSLVDDVDIKEEDFLNKLE